jgi:hypothetical protein
VSLLSPLYLREVRLEAIDPVRDPNWPLREARVQLSRSAVWPFGKRRLKEIIPASGAESYADLSKSPAGRSVTEFLRMPHRREPVSSLIRRVPLRLRIDPKCVAVCWEGAIGLQGGAVEQAASLAFNCYRSDFATTRSGATDLLAPIFIQFLTASNRAGSLAAWARLFDQSGSFVGESILPFARPDAFQANILHVMCEVAEGSSGLELYFTRDAPPALEFEQNETVSAPGRMSPRLLASGPKGPPRLCILQGFSLAGTERTQSDRYAAGLMRRAASELFDAGTLAVLVIPPVPEALSAEVVRPVVSAVENRRRNGTAALLRAAGQIRRMIAPSKDDPDALERALDVCLYCVPDLRLSASIAKD